jgi:hypothetical protein
LPVGSYESVVTSCGEEEVSVEEDVLSLGSDREAFDFDVDGSASSSL